MMQKAIYANLNRKCNLLKIALQMKEQIPEAVVRRLQISCS